MRTIALIRKLFISVTLTFTAVAAILCILWVLHKYPFSTPIHEVDVHGGYYTNFNVGTNTRKIRGPYILTMEFAGQQGAGTYALVSQQCFVSNLGLPAYIVEPFVINSVLRHTYPNTHDRNTHMKFSDLFDIDTFNTESVKSGYEPLVRWERFLNSGPDRAILVELQSALQKEKGCFNPARVISVASSLPNNVHTSSHC